VTRARRPLLLLAIAAAWTLVAPAARGDEGVTPEKQGWWTATAAPAPALVPTGGAAAGTPDVAKGQLYVSGSANNVVGVSALRYLLPHGAVAESLSLTTAPGTVTVPGTKVRACPLTGTRDFTAADGAPTSDAPAWDCSHAVPGELDPTGVAYRFAVAPFTQDDVLAIAIVPAGTADRVVLAAPDPTALVLTGSSTSSSTFGPGSSTAPVGATSSRPLSSPTRAAPATSARPQSSTAAPGTSTGAAAPSSAIVKATPAAVVGHGNTPPSAMVGTFGLLALAAGVWWRGRRTVEELAPAVQ